MIDLFYPPKIEPKAPTVVHVLSDVEPPPAPKKIPNSTKYRRRKAWERDMIMASLDEWWRDRSK